LFHVIITILGMMEVDVDVGNVEIPDDFKELMGRGIQLLPEAEQIQSVCDYAEIRDLSFDDDVSINFALLITGNITNSITYSEQG